MAESIIKGRGKNLGGFIDISSYKSSQYTFPSDGYVTASCGAGSAAKALVRIFGASGSESTNFNVGGWGNGTYGNWSCFVFAGMKAKVVTLENSGKVIFTPLI